MKNYYVFQDWLAQKLIKLGFVCAQRPDLKNPIRTVYIFENSDELQNAISKIKK